MKNYGAMLILFAMASFWSGACVSGGRLDELDRNMDELDTYCKKTAESLLQQDPFKVRDEVIKMSFDSGLSCFQNGSALKNRFEEDLCKDMHDSENKKFCDDLFKFMSDPIIKLREQSAKVESAARSGRDWRPPMKELLDAYKIVEDKYNTARNSILHYVAERKKQAEETSKGWIDARKDDDEIYKRNLNKLNETLQKTIGLNKKGEELLSKLKDMDSEWQRANQTGKQEEIEKAYKKYHETNAQLVYWQKDMEQLNKEFQGVSMEVATGWSKFVDETRASFGLYSNKVAAANRRYHEVNHYIFGN